MVKTKVGIPNTCCNCGKPQNKQWYAHHDDMARSGQGYCLSCKNSIEAPQEPAKSDTDADKPQENSNATDQITISKEESP